MLWKYYRHNISLKYYYIFLKKKITYFQNSIHTHLFHLTHIANFFFFFIAETTIDLFIHNHIAQWKREKMSILLPNNDLIFLFLNTWCNKHFTPVVGYKKIKSHWCDLGKPSTSNQVLDPKKKPYLGPSSVSRIPSPQQLRLKILMWKEGVEEYHHQRVEKDTSYHYQ